MPNLSKNTHSSKFLSTTTKKPLKFKISPVATHPIAKKMESSQTRTEVLSIFGSSIRYYRRRLALSQEDLAWRIGVHRTYIGGIERGERNLSIGKVLEIAGALKIQPEDLMVQVDEYMGKL